MNKFKVNESVKLKETSKVKYPEKGKAIWIEKVLGGGMYTVFDGQASFDLDGEELENNPNIKDISYF